MLLLLPNSGLWLTALELCSRLSGLWMSLSVKLATTEGHADLAGLSYHGGKKLHVR